MSVAVFATALLLAASGAQARQDTVPAPPKVQDSWQNRDLSVDQRVERLLAALTQTEKLSLISGWFGSDQPWNGFKADPLARYASAGFVPGVSRLGLTPQWQTDAGVGVATQGAFKDKPLERTALPSGLAIASSWNPALAEQGGAMIGAEARASGHNVMLAGGVNLLREPRNGRNFEYGGEDPLLAGTMVGAAARGIESNHIVSTIKHFALNDQETGRDIVNVVIDPDAARMSDLLAFQIALETSGAGAVMCAYNKVGGAYSCENDWLQNRVLKGDFGFRGFVMSDWGAVHSTADAANHGLDQETGHTKASGLHFGEKLDAAIKAGEVPQARLDDMVRRIVWALIAKGAVDDPVSLAPIDYAKGAAVTRAAATQGAVLLKNEHAVLPLSPSIRRIAVIGGHADVGVLLGGGSAQVYPRGGSPVTGIEPTGWPGPVVYAPSSPLKAIAARAPGARVRFASGQDLAVAASLAADSDVAVVFVTQWTAESRDFSLSLPDNQDALVAAVAKANPRTIVVLETGGPVLTPWMDEVAGALEAWYPGTEGGDAIADLLFGVANPSGHLPATFPKSLDQLPRQTLDGEGLSRGTPFDTVYAEGAAVGYRWFDLHALEPRFAFGHGLSYTRFAYSDLRAERDGERLKVRFKVRNVGDRAGADTPQVYVGPAKGGWEAPRRLGAFAKVTLAPGAEQEVTTLVDPRLLALFNSQAGGWSRIAGDYRVWLGGSSRDLKLDTTVALPDSVLAPNWRPVTGEKP
jgi:beta-glucosidase